MGNQDSDPSTFEDQYHWGSNFPGSNIAKINCSLEKILHFDPLLTSWGKDPKFLSIDKENLSGN